MWDLARTLLSTASMRRRQMVLAILITAASGCTKDASSAMDIGSPTNNDETSPLPEGAVANDVADAGPPGSSWPKQPLCNGVQEASSGDRTITLPSGRSARLHVPPKYDPRERTMVVLNFHGTPMTAAMQQAYTGMDALSDARGFLVAYPEGAKMAWNAGACCRPGQTKITEQLIEDGPDELAYVRELLAWMKEAFCIDARRIFATGISNGAFMTFRLGCEMADTFAAIAPVAGSLVLPPSACKPSRPVPLIQFHGTNDTRVPIDDTLNPKEDGNDGLMSATKSNAFWRRTNGCNGSKVVYERGDATCVRSSTCAADASVELCTIQGGGHTWPGAKRTPVSLLLGATTQDISANERMLDFFEQHTMR